MDNITISGLLDGAGFQASTMLICAASIFYFLVRSKSDKSHSKLFLWLLINVFLSATCNLASAFTKPLCATSDTAFLLQRIAHQSYFILHFMLAPSFGIYIFHLMGLHYGFSALRKTVYAAPGVVMVFIAVVNPLTYWLYYYDADRGYHRNVGMTVPYVICTLYYISALMVVFFFWKMLSRKRKIVMVFFSVMIVVGVLVQLMMPLVHIELLMEAMGLVGIMVTIGNEDDLMDQRTQIFNHEALEFDLNVYNRIKRPYCIVILKINNPSAIKRYSGLAGVGAIAAMNAEYLATLEPRRSIYLASIGTFAIISENTDINYNLELAKKIKKRYEYTWHYKERDIKYDASVLCAQVPKDFSSPEEIMMLVNSPISENIKKQEDILCGESLHFIVRQNKVDAAIINGLEKRNFEVYYQPIYRTSDLGICSCEALARLHDEEFGEIYPNEFLPVIERSGMIFDLGDFVLNEVCVFLNSGIPTEMGIENIGINLSMMQCVQQTYADRIMNIVSKYSIDPSKIEFEITEATAVTDFDSLKTFIDRLRKFGFKFSVDNYGIGYSNISQTLSLDVGIVKLDKSLLWEAERSQVGRIIMESTANTIKKLGKNILIVGIETKSQIDIAKSFDVDLLQGYYFSNPLTQNELISILKATQLARFEEQKALAASEAMSNFLASMSHEIRTPINAVLGMDEMILRECGDGKILEYAKNIEGAGRTLLSIINDILDLSKIEAGNLEINEARYELSTLISDVINMIRIKADNKGLEVKCEIDPSTPEALCGDEIRIRQILLNLMNNAVKYTEKGSVYLKVGYEKAGKDTIKLMMSVKDTGIGIREEDKERLFDKFRRFDIEKNKTVEGSGLGLAITSQLIANMNGVIDVESEYGQGSTFYVIIPQKVFSRTAVGDVNTDSSKTGSVKERTSARFHAPDAKILIVDDTLMNLMVVKALLKRTDIQTDEALSGAECLEKMGKETYDLILLDYRMPEMDGIEVLKRIKALENNANSHIPVIALTANAISGAREKFIAEGFDDFITKPVDGDRLERVLMVYLPSDKVKLPNASDAEPETETETETEPLPDTNDQGEKKERPEVKGIDRELGIKNCGSEEVYDSILQVFTDDLENKTKAVREALEKGDIKRYTVEVHALKSSARTVGAAEISSLAEELENAGNEGDTARIEADTERLLKMYEGLVAQVTNKEQKEEDLGSKSTGDTPEVEILTEEMWKDALGTIREFAQLMDYDNAALVLRSLKGYSMSDTIREQSKQIRSMVDALKWDEVQTFADKIIQG